MEQSERNKLEAELRDYAHQYYDDKITKHYTAVVFLAQKEV